jgi:prepilin-type processing-associated H-X9-DG protein
VDGPITAALWPVRLRPFLGGNKDVFYCPSRDERCRWTNDDRPIPATDVFVRHGYDPGEPLLHQSKFFSYGYNGIGASRRGLGLRFIGAEGATMYGPPRASQVRQPSDMIAVTDSDANGLWDFELNPMVQWPQDIPLRPLPGRVHPVAAHGGGSNVLFCDGHVAWFDQEELLVHLMPLTPKDLARSRRWNYDHEPYNPALP